MNKLEKLEMLIVRNKGVPDNFELLLRSIEFFRVELGILDTELPTTFYEAFLEHKKYSARVIAPPSNEQLEKLDEIMYEIDGTLWGELRSSQQVDLLIKELKAVKAEIEEMNVNTRSDQLVVFLGTAGVSLPDKFYPIKITEPRLIYTPSIESSNIESSSVRSLVLESPINKSAPKESKDKESPAFEFPTVSSNYHNPQRVDHWFEFWFAFIIVVPMGGIGMISYFYFPGFTMFAGVVFLNLLLLTGLFLNLK